MSDDDEITIFSKDTAKQPGDTFSVKRNDGNRIQTVDVQVTERLEDQYSSNAHGNSGKPVGRGYYKAQILPTRKSK